MQVKRSIFANTLVSGGKKRGGEREKTRMGENWQLSNICFCKMFKQKEILRDFGKGSGYLI